MSADVIRVIRRVSKIAISIRLMTPRGAKSLRDAAWARANLAVLPDEADH